MDAESLPQGRLSGRTAFVQAVRDALARAASEGWNELILCDRDFHDWPLGEREVADSLQAWARGRRRFVMLALDFRPVQIHHPRFVRWRQTWDHLIECRLAQSSDPDSFPSLIWTPAWGMQRIDSERDVAICDHGPARRVQWHQLLDEVRKTSRPGFSASILGL